MKGKAAGAVWLVTAFIALNVTLFAEVRCLAETK
jgi:hypothetical protein